MEGDGSYRGAGGPMSEWKENLSPHNCLQPFDKGVLSHVLGKGICSFLQKGSDFPGVDKIHAGLTPALDLYRY